MRATDEPLEVHMFVSIGQGIESFKYRVEEITDHIRNIDWFYLNKLRKLDPRIVAKVAVMNLAMLACFWRWTVLVGDGQPAFTRLTILIAIVAVGGTVALRTLDEANQLEKSPIAALIVRGTFVLVPTVFLWIVLDLQAVRHNLSSRSLQAAVFAVAYVWLFGWDVKLAHPYHHARVRPEREAVAMPRTDLSDSTDLVPEAPIDAELVDEPAPQMYPGPVGSYMANGRGYSGPATIYDSRAAQAATE